MENSLSTRLSGLMIIRIVYAVLGLALTATILWASFNANIIDSFNFIITDPWGVVAMVDLYLGFLIFAALVLVVDGLKPKSFVWVVALMCLGNILAVLWLVLRLPTLVGRFST